MPRVPAGGPQLGSVVRGEGLTCGHVNQLPGEGRLGEGDLVVGVANKLGPERIILSH